MGAAVRLIHVPFNSAGLTSGVARMPGALEAAGVRARTATSGPTSSDWVEVHGLTPERGPSGLVADTALVAMVTDVSASLRRAWGVPAVPVVVAGDCPVLLSPLVAMHDQGGAGLVFVDGHEDAWPPAASTTGEAADSEIALALGLYPGPPALQRLLPCLDAAHLLMLGPRDRDELETAGVTSVSDRVRMLTDADLSHVDVDALVPTAVRETAATAPAGWWFHVDLDVLQTTALAAVDYPQPGGITWERLEGLTRAVLSVAGCRGASVVIYNPDLDGGAAAARVADYVALVAACLR